MKTARVYCYVLAALALGGCGEEYKTMHGEVAGRFDLRAAYTEYLKAAELKRLPVSDDCFISVSSVDGSHSVPPIFSGSIASLANSTVTLSFTDCSSSSLKIDTGPSSLKGYAPIGVSLGGDYPASELQSLLPSLIKVGDSGVLGEFIWYGDESKTIPFGLEAVSYFVEEDENKNPIVIFELQAFDSGGRLVVSQLEKYRFEVKSGLILVSLELLFSSKSIRKSLLINSPLLSNFKIKANSI